MPLGQFVDQELMRDDLRVEQVLPLTHREIREFSCQRACHVASPDEVHDFLAREKCLQLSVPQPHPTVSAEQEGDPSEPRVPYEISHQLQFHLGGKARLLSRSGRPSRDELHGALQIFPRIPKNLSDPFGRRIRYGRLLLRSLVLRRAIAWRFRLDGGGVQEKLEDELGGQRGLGRFQPCPCAEFLVLSQPECATHEIAVTTAFRGHLLDRPQLHEILVEGTEQIEREVVRLGFGRGREDETEAGSPRQHILERLPIERVVHQDAARQGGSRGSEDRGHAYPFSG